MYNIATSLLHVLILRHLRRHMQRAAGDVFPSLRQGTCAEDADLRAARRAVVAKVRKRKKQMQGCHVWTLVLLSGSLL